jgi:nucleolar GTP-binding protein
MHASLTRFCASAEMEALFRRGGGAVDELKEMAKALRALPVAELRSPTVALLGAPNVGKSSMVRLLSTGTPEVANYPFTTRGVAMGHILAPDGARCVLTDTPGVLLRADASRNRMERLTLAALAFLPCGVVFVADLSGRCGTPPAEQLLIRAELRRRAAGRPWLDVLSKWDLVDLNEPGAAAAAAALPNALRVAVTEGMGTDELRRAVAALLADTQASVMRDAADASDAVAEAEAAAAGPAGAYDDEEEEE